MKLKSVGFASIIFLWSAAIAAAQMPPPMPAAPTPNLNPSGPSLVTQPPPVPVSPATPGPAPGSNLAGTNQVANPHQSVFHAHHRRHSQPQ